MRAIVMSIGLLAIAVNADARPGTATKYRPATIFGGYKDKVVEPGVWRVQGLANGMAEDGFAQNMAVYRAADVVKQAGFEYMQIINQKGKKSFVGLGGASSMHSAGQDLTLWVRGSHDSSPPSECRAKDPKACFTVPVSETLDHIRPFLTFPSDGS